MSAQPEQADVVQRALSSAGIPPERFGPARLTQLDDGERALYRWILASFARSSPPPIYELCDHASELGLQIEETLDLFAKLDLVHHDPASGEILVAYPFSARPRGHSVLINNTHRVEAMCAIDALGIAPMLQQPVEITSHDPHSGTEIWVRLDPGEGAWWEPPSAVVLAGSSSCDGPSYRGCCDVLNYFETEASANSYLAAHSELTGFPIAIPEAIEAGRTVFADLLKGAERCRLRSTATNSNASSATSKPNSSRCCRPTSTRTSTCPARSTSRSRRSTARQPRRSTATGR